MPGSPDGIMVSVVSSFASRAGALAERKMPAIRHDSDNKKEERKDRPRIESSREVSGRLNARWNRRSLSRLALAIVPCAGLQARPGYEARRQVRRAPREVFPDRAA